MQASTGLPAATRTIASEVIGRKAEFACGSATLAPHRRGPWGNRTTVVEGAATESESKLAYKPAYKHPPPVPPKTQPSPA
jgi:hypothetical protein